LLVRQLESYRLTPTLIVVIVINTGSLT